MPNGDPWERDTNDDENVDEMPDIPNGVDSFDDDEEDDSEWQAYRAFWNNTYHAYGIGIGRDVM